MNEIWHFLREFESKDLVKRYVKNKFDFELNNAKASEIVSAFKQGRSYFKSASVADISVNPLLQYYGIVSLSRGLILILNKTSRENNIKPSHGLKIVNWSDVSKSGNIKDIVIKTTNGTFKELIRATNNTSYFRAGSSGINWKADYDVLIDDYKLNLKELTYSFPDLKQSAESWLNIEIPSRALNKLNTTIEELNLTVELQGKGLTKDIFPESIFGKIETTELQHTTKITYDTSIVPHLSQKWVSAFQTIGDPYAIPPFENGIFLNDIAKTFAVSFIFGTIARYYPTTWNNINSGIKNDSVLPFAINFMDFAKDKFPRMVLDFIEAPHEFERK
jgi:hypothetical protein